MSRNLIVVDLACGFCASPTKGGNRFCSKACAARHMTKVRRADPDTLRRVAADRRSYSGADNPNYRGGKSSHPLYYTYRDMVARCTRPTHHRWASYGGRGITVCDRWRSDFWTFVHDMGERPPGLSLDRINNDGPYSPDNCRWATNSQQSKNRRASAYAGNRNRAKAGSLA
ncbi:hypothetical protein [Mycobacteroides immunogenum]|nr:hypothetical protein [Mycobacteroides immunogenum]MCV7307339.1 hypothetical protein [Mycobacteroides immunogenum]